LADEVFIAHATAGVLLEALARSMHARETSLTSKGVAQ
jgi:hypothetical protein